ncbi:hypothetical protein CMV16_26600 [Peribacillus simplex]|nr:hypothetical protein CMV16_26600 [Peribacillus simplex]
MERNNNRHFKTTFNRVTLVDFWAPRCGPCRVQLPIVEELADEMKGQATIAKGNKDNDPELAIQFGIMVDKWQIHRT